MKTVRILFVGNSHTFVNFLPALVMKKAEADGMQVDAVMITHGGWFLAQHVQEPEVQFNIRYGHYDYVVLQEHSHPFAPEKKYTEAAAALCGWIREAGSTPVIYATWSTEAEPQVQAYMNDIHRRTAETNGALLAPVGETWWQYKEAHPDVTMYNEDGQHASPAGSDFAAGIIWETVKGDFLKKA